MGRALGLAAIVGWTLALSAGRCAPAAPSPSPESQPLDEVTVTAGRLYDRNTLDRQIIPRFVESHAQLNPKIEQIGRWATPLCPVVLGLQPVYADLISHRILDDAAGVGAPYRVGPCKPNVEILFTPTPQAQVDSLRKRSPFIFGYNERSPEDVTRFARAVQAWYVTGSRGPDGVWQLDSDARMYF